MNVETVEKIETVKVYERPMIVYEGTISTRCCSGKGATNDDLVDPAELFTRK